ncbi:hypothetical protein [Flammeovirga sp. OC4]|uniref:hypothetical protein n=1 Tax=Flammeovirga sp. OC4 TaxID=1382345 RepID=UPI0005C48B8E|nr:hypothetical protein [Flammeovirga sp. OC4]
MGEEVFFSRWTRKGYAVFNSLKKEIRIGMLDIQLHFHFPQIIKESHCISALIMMNEDEECQKAASITAPDLNSILVFNEAFVNKTPNLGPLTRVFYYFNTTKH